MTPSETLASVIDAAKGKGVFPEWFRPRERGFHMCLVRRTCALCREIDTETLIAIGCMAEWLGKRGVAVVSTTPDVWWRIEYDKMGYKGAMSLDATDHHSALLAAVAARLEALPAATSAEKGAGDGN